MPLERTIIMKIKTTVLIWMLSGIGWAGLTWAQELKPKAAEPATKAEPASAGTGIAGSPPQNPNQYKPSIDKEESGACKKNLEKINAAILAYRKDHEDVPNWLSELVPKYLTDTNLLICPATTRTGQQSPFGVLDPRIYSSYLYEFTPTPIPEVVKGAWPAP